MPFFSGRMTCCRCRLGGRPIRNLGQEQLDKLAAHAIGEQRQIAADGAVVGWIAADHILDTQFDLAKNLINDALHFAIRIDTQAIPSDLVRAYTQVELKALAAHNPSGIPSSRQKREARHLAKERLEQEAKDGRFLRRKAVPILWDGPSGEMLIGSNAVTVLDRLLTLFRQTFDRTFELLTAGNLAFARAESQGRSVDDAVPSIFVPGQTHQIAWVPDETNRDFLGNEFLMWLWYYLLNVSDSVPLSDGSEVTLMSSQSLVLECPRGQTGKETISSDGPAKLPEAFRAIQSGKLPRRAGLTMVRHDSQYELTLQAESLTVSGARLPAAEGDNDRARLEERVTQIRHLLETLDLLYDTFCQHRLGGDWGKEQAKIKKWLKVE
jgi:hypothetical protein